MENTYLSTFQSLGGLGLILGTIGLAAVLLRNVLERRGEMALLRAVGYRRQTLAMMLVAEHLLLMVSGLAVRDDQRARRDCAGAVGARRRGAGGDGRRCCWWR